jgi:hypothetical protein
MQPDPQLAMLSSSSTEDLIPVDQPIRRMRAVVAMSSIRAERRSANG